MNNLTTELIESVIGFVLIDGLIVCLKRRQDDRHFPGKWCFPGGKIENGETSFDALIREVNEEVGLPPTDDFSFIGKYRTTTDEGKRVYLISAFQLKYSFPVSIRLSNEHSDIKLCTPNEVLELELAGPVSEAILSKYFEAINIEGE
jgi:8-oxo-dGTP pyrophosphatase MutT (NUDIX family)